MLTLEVLELLSMNHMFMFHGCTCKTSCATYAHQLAYKIMRNFAEAEYITFISRNLYIAQEYLPLVSIIDINLHMSIDTKRPQIKKKLRKYHCLIYCICLYK